jgi:hypothetical protein
MVNEKDRKPTSRGVRAEPDGEGGGPALCASGLFAL